MALRPSEFIRRADTSGGGTSKKEFNIAVEKYLVNSTLTESQKKHAIARVTVAFHKQGKPLVSKKKKKMAASKPINSLAKNLKKTNAEPLKQCAIPVAGYTRPENRPVYQDPAGGYYWYDAKDQRTYADYRDGTVG